MRVRGLYTGAFYSGEPSEAFVYRHVGKGSGAGAHNFEYIQLFKHGRRVGFAGDGSEAVCVREQFNSEPFVAFAHHYKPDVDKFLAFNPGYYPYDGVFI